MPDLPRERTANDDVLHGLLGLIAKDAAVVVRQAMPGKSSCGPATVEVGEPSEDFDSQGGPAFPCQAPEGGRGGAGGVAHSAAALLGSWSKPYTGISDPLIIEAFSLRDGVLLAALRGLSHVIMEVDCLELVMLWKTRHNSRSVVSPILL